MEQHPPAQALLRLGPFLRQQYEQVLAVWHELVSRLPSAAGLSRKEIRDYVPRLLDRLIDLAEAIARGESAQLPDDAPDIHALDRMRSGYEMREVVTECTLLREAIISHWNATVRQTMDPTDVWLLSRAIDKAVLACVARYGQTRERMLAALDRMSLAIFHAKDAERTLGVLAHTMVDATDDVECVVILLSEGDSLVVAEAMGLETNGKDMRGFRVPIGEGFAGRVAAERAPSMFHEASSDPSFHSAIVSGQQLRALYGVPLMNDDRVIGVVLMGSRKVSDFSEEDLLVFRAMSARVTSILTKMQLNEYMRRNAEFEKHLIGIVSHDLRSPIAAVTLGCQIILRHDDLTEQQTRAVLRVQQAGERAARMVMDLLDFTKARFGGLTVNRSHASLHGIVQRVVDEVKLAYPDREITVAHSGVGEGEFDADRLAQVLTNLLTNALAYSPSNTPVRVATRTDQDIASLTVHNEGEPIPTDRLPHIFEPLQRATEAGPRRNIGLGLFIVTAIVKAHGGTVTVESTKESGTTFTVQLRRRHAHS